MKFQINDQIEIIISVNKSDHNIIKFSKQITNNKYFKNTKFFFHKKNIGPILNLYYTFKKAKYEYILVLADDDKIEFGFISRALKLIYKYPDIGIFLHQKKFPQKKEKFSYRIYSYGKDAVYQSFVHSGSFPGTIFKKNNLKKNFLNKLKISNLYPQLYFMSKMAETSDAILVTYDKQILMGRNSVKYNDRMILNYTKERGDDHGLTMRNDVIKKLFTSKKLNFFNKEILLMHSNRFFYQQCLYFVKMKKYDFLKKKLIPSYIKSDQNRSSFSFYFYWTKLLFKHKIFRQFFKDKIIFRLLKDITDYSLYLGFFEILKLFLKSKFKLMKFKVQYRN